MDHAIGAGEVRSWAAGLEALHARIAPPVCATGTPAAGPGLSAGPVEPGRAQERLAPGGGRRRGDAGRDAGDAGATTGCRGAGGVGDRRRCLLRGSGLRPWLEERDVPHVLAVERTEPLFVATARAGP